MKVINANSFGEAWIAYVKYGLELGTHIQSKDEEILETEPVFLGIDLQAKQNVDKIIQLHGNPTVIKLYRDKMFSEEVLPEINSTYGDMLFNNQGVNMVEWMINKLKKNPFTKGAITGLLSPVILSQPKRRIPCLATLQYKIRNNQLITYTTFRSQNIKNSYANMLGVASITKEVARQLNIGKGSYYHYISSPHIYSKDIKYLTKIANNES